MQGYAFQRGAHIKQTTVGTLNTESLNDKCMLHVDPFSCLNLQLDFNEI